MSSPWEKFFGPPPTESGSSTSNAEFGAKAFVNRPHFFDTNHGFEDVVVKTLLLDTIDSVEELRALKERIGKMDGAMQNYNMMWRMGGPSPFDSLYDKVDKRIEEVSPAKYKEPCPSSIEEVVNGFKMHNVTTNAMGFDSYLDMVKRWKAAEETPRMSDEKFAEYLDGGLCTDWSKMDENGESYGGPFYTAPEGSEERENAYDLTRKRNVDFLVGLPYPQHFIVYIACVVGCNSRQECVRYVNFVCEWTRRKMLAMAQSDNTNLESVQRPTPNENAAT